MYSEGVQFFLVLHVSIIITTKFQLSILSTQQQQQPPNLYIAYIRVHKHSHRLHSNINIKTMNDEVENFSCWVYSHSNNRNTIIIMRNNFTHALLICLSFQNVKIINYHPKYVRQQNDNYFNIPPSHNHNFNFQTPTTFNITTTLQLSIYP